ncbi:ADP-ribosylation factor-like protein 11 isoform X1 [Cheilinus undulatus]|uniref:ADP-ribosylation factor-like protein 11 isoform X1 n=1 Tax=Cheilinus undulatus TaxID=241271 RepID=UPI001BD626AB|nr:ADP-ribosylation factor-like protein 11 isoform X1 [Cheilinus undulatus]XP_041638021.1 ADP-ribosylation factor-like protein 11 isoform X1 [Cheilinus undulatus]
MGQNHSSSPQVILMGLDSSGKSTLLARLLTGEVMETSPTIGFNVGTLDPDKKMSLTVWDIGGQQSMRQNWRYFLDDSGSWFLFFRYFLDDSGSWFLFFRYFLDDCKALVFVVDSSDRSRMPEAQKALKKVLKDERLRGVPLMVLANKKDLPNSMTIREISNQLDLPNHSERLWEVQACSALKGLGLKQAFISVHKLIKKS